MILTIVKACSIEVNSERNVINSVFLSRNEVRVLKQVNK